MNVEMDPEHQVQLVTQINDKNMRVVGWYHSHPHFW
jgi:proteasome lid subunit RPN8/RPN11